MFFKGQIRKMATELAEPIQYYLNLSGDILSVNQLFGSKIKIQHTGFQCIECGESQPIFRMGFCKKCFFESPYASETIIRPELSTAHLGIAERNLDVEKEIQLQPHIVYLAHTGEVKVGVTRESQVPTRWIDQGANYAIPIARTTNRYEAGMIEVELKKYFSDKTNFRKMLSTEPSDRIKNELLQKYYEIQIFFPQQYNKFYLENQEIIELYFPYQSSEKISVLTLEKKPIFEGVLKGIKGQYLHFDGDYFINIRNHEGYVVDLEID